MKNYLKKIINNQNLTADEAADAIEVCVRGEASNAQMGAFLAALATKGETEEEIFGIVKIMRSHMIKIRVNGKLLDTCGTGGDGSSTINVSTLAALVCAAAGVRVAKHGNRAASSRCGSFDLLEQLGVRIDMTPEESTKCLEKVGIACLFAPIYHSAMKIFAPIRKELGIRTLFNYIGPLLNPAGVARQLLGVCSANKAEILGNILIRLGAERIVAVHSEDGLDEVSISAPTQIIEFQRGVVPRHYIIKPEKFYSLEDVRGGGPRENAVIAKIILSGRGTVAQNEFVALNAGAALLATGAVNNISEGRKKALAILSSGAAMNKLNELCEYQKTI